MPSNKSRIQLDTEFGFIDSEVRSDRILNPVLVANEKSNTMFEALRSELSSAESFIFSVAFVTTEGLGAIKQSLVEFGGHGTIITSDYLDFNTPDALLELQALQNVDVRILQDTPHHAKGYIFKRDDHTTAIVGSSNLTRGALMSNNEWNIRFSTHNDGDIADQLLNAAQRQIDLSVPLTEAWIEDYAKRRRERVVLEDDQYQPLELTPTGTKILPNAMQVEALENLQAVIDSGEKRALIISATGTGKTILAALAVRESDPGRVLFIAHRRLILNKAAEEFKRVLDIDDSEIGIFAGNIRQLDRKFVFAMIDTLAPQDNLSEISPLLFDYIVIDEVHRSGAKSYRRVINYFRPKFLLGLTATPERTDNFNVFELFDFNVPYEIRLGGALEERMLVPFDYYGVSDYQASHGFTIDDRSQTGVLTSQERIQYVARTIEAYGFPNNVRGLVFCSSKVEAQLLSEGLNQHFVYGRQLRTVSLSGEDSDDRRNDAINQLENGDLDYIVTVDIFNEGIDIPSVNQVIMLRGTQSSIVFTQQLGRGLRKSQGKKSMRVIDFIGNYANNYLIPIALTGENSGDKSAVRRGLNEALREPIAGLSTISFDEVSTARVLESLQGVALNGRAAAKEAIQNLRNRLGKLPRLIDFVHHESMHPVLVARHDGNYWAFLHKQRFVDQGPSELEDPILRMLSLELLNGKRPQELLLLKELLLRQELSRSEFVAILDSKGLDSDEILISTVEKVLDLTWYSKPMQSSFGSEPLVVKTGDTYRLGDKLAGLYFSYAGGESPSSFRTHVDDVIETGLLLNRKFFGASDQLQVGKQYTYREIFRILNWSKNMESTSGGFMIHPKTNKCPIFITYHKESETSSSQNYGDRFIDSSTMHWFSPNRRNLASPDLQPILNNEVDQLLFVRREKKKGESEPFYYLGQSRSTNPQQSAMPGNDGETLEVVTTDLKLHTPVPPSLFDTITAPKTVAAPKSYTPKPTPR